MSSFFSVLGPYGKIKLVVAIIGSCGVYKQWKQSGNFVRNPTDWLAAGINVGVLTSGLCGTISLHFGEQSIPLYQLYQAFIALNFIGCIAVSTELSCNAVNVFRPRFWYYWSFFQHHAVLKSDFVTQKSFASLFFHFLVSFKFSIVVK